MEIIPVTDRRFAEYGQIVEGFDLTEILTLLQDATPLPADSTVYVASDANLEACAVAKELKDRGFGGLDVQIGYCNGVNSKLTCLEYHCTSEIDLAATDMILLLARQPEMENYQLDTKNIRAFFVPKGTVVELFATTLHYAPCGAAAGRGFRMGCVLPRNTNGEKPVVKCGAPEDRLLWGLNKWVIASPGTQEAADGAFVGITGDPVALEYT